MSDIFFKIQHRGELVKLLDYFNLPYKVAEIGVAEGRFSLEIFNWGVSELYLVDLWETMPFIEGCGSFDQEWHDKNYKNVCKLFENEKNVSILKGFSHKMAELIPDGSLGLVYLDGDHSYNGTKADLKYWWPKLCDGGILACHDYNETYGVKRAVIEFVGGEGKVTEIPENGDPENVGCWVRKI